MVMEPNVVIKTGFGCTLMPKRTLTISSLSLSHIFMVMGGEVDRRFKYVAVMFDARVC